MVCFSSMYNFGACIRCDYALCPRLFSLELFTRRSTLIKFARSLRVFQVGWDPYFPTLLLILDLTLWCLPSHCYNCCTSTLGWETFYAPIVEWLYSVAFTFVKSRCGWQLHLQDHTKDTCYVMVMKWPLVLSAVHSEPILTATALTDQEWSQSLVILISFLYSDLLLIPMHI